MKIVISVHAHGLAFRLAEGLDKKGVLEKIYTIYPKFRLTHYKISSKHIKNLWLIGGAKFLNIRLGNHISSDFISNIFDWLVALNLKALKDKWIFHGFSGFSERAMRRAKKLGAVTVIERGCLHIDFQRELIAEEKSRLLGQKFLPENKPTYDRMKREYESADYIFVPSRYSQRSFIEKGFSESKVIRIPLCNEKATFPPPEPKKLDKFTVFCVGGHFYRKGIFYLLKAWKELNLKNAELLLRSDIPKEFPQLMNLPGVVYLRPLSGEEIIPWYQKAHIFVLPSIDEGFGMVTVEALAAGLPVVVTNNVGSSDIVDDGKDGFIVPIRDSGALKDKILFFYNNPEKVKEMSRSALEKAKEYSKEKFTERMIEAYSRMIS
jgi:glycosyltransferase involved in cell wall biosynthesis